MAAVKLNADIKQLEGAFDQLQKLADKDPNVMKEFHSLFTGPNDVCSIAASVVVGDEIIVTLTASDRFLEFLANRQ